MAKNLEIKATIKNKNSCMSKAEKLSGSEPEIIHQEDIFFHCEEGRLKLRIFEPNSGVLIFYQRPDQKGPKISEYFISETAEPAKLKEVLGHAYGILGKVTKTRHLFMVGRTRIHIDQVHDLGEFVELEVVLSEAEDPKQGEVIAQKLMKELHIQENDLIQCSYFDLLLKQ